MEVQIWITYDAEGSQKQRPRNRDKLIGSAYIDMTSLADSRRRQHRVRYVYMLQISELIVFCVYNHFTSASGEERLLWYLGQKRSSAVKHLGKTESKMKHGHDFEVAINSPCDAMVLLTVVRQLIVFVG